MLTLTPRSLARMLPVLLLTTTALLGVTPAHAHTALLDSDPADGSTQSAVPTAITLTFNEKMSPDLSAVTLTLDGEKPLQLDLENGTTDEQLVAAVPADSTGSEWTVAYRVVSSDGHPVTGSLDFTVTAPTAPSTAPSAEQSAVPSTEPTDAATRSTEESSSTNADDDDSSVAWWIGGGIALLVVVAIVLAGRRANQRRSAR